MDHAHPNVSPPASTQPPEQPNPAEQTDPAEQPDSSPLDRVVDDLEAKLAWGEWAVDEMIRGRSVEELTDELTANGWSEDDAAELVETARRQTRHLRGVVTRDEVARENAARYHKATALTWFTPILSIASAWRLLNSLSFILGSRRSRAAQSPGFPVEPPALGPPEPPADASRVPSANESRSE